MKLKAAVLSATVAMAVGGTAMAWDEDRERHRIALESARFLRDYKYKKGIFERQLKWLERDMQRTEKYKMEQCSKVAEAPPDILERAYERCALAASNALSNKHKWRDAATKYRDFLRAASAKMKEYERLLTQKSKKYVF